MFKKNIKLLTKMTIIKRDLIVVILFSIFFSCSVDYNKEVEVLLPNTFFHKALQTSKYKKEPVKKDLELYNQFHSIYEYGQIDTCYTDSLNRIRVFTFQIDSGFSGYAEIKYDSTYSKISNIFFYNRFNVSLRKSFTPSAYLSYYHSDVDMVYDSFYDKLFIINKHLLQPIEKGVLTLDLTNKNSNLH